MEEIKLKEYFYIVWNRLWIVMLITFLFIVASGIISYFILVPEYETFTTLILGKADTGTGSEAIQYNDILINQQLVSTYGEIAKSKLISNEVIKNLGLNITAEQMKNKVNVSLVSDTEIIKIVVRDKDSELAAKIANEIAEVFKKNIVTIMKIENVQVIDKAEVPTSPFKPRPILNIGVAGVLGIMTSVLLIFLLYCMDNTIKTSTDIERYLELPVVGTIPKSLEGELVIRSNPKSPISEAYRTFRTNIQFSNIDENIKSIVVTSSEPNEGKSTVISNLAIAMAQGDKKVLLIDADLRRPTIHRNFSLSNSHGLTIILSTNTDYENIIVSTGMGSLDILTSGPIPPNPAELLGSNKMKNFLEKVKEDYDMILLDAPPVGMVTDAAVLSAECDRVILVCSAHESIINSTIQTKKLLQRVNANILGAVMNKIPIKESGYNRHYFDDYYQS